MKTSTLWACVGAMVFGLSACSSSHDELAQWTVGQRNAAKPNVDPVQPPTKFQPQEYLGATAVAPFGMDKLQSALRRETANAATSALLAPELVRRREALEAMPLDTMTMVGLLEKGGRKVALVKAENLLYQVRVGNHLGQNYGRITRITDTEITLREIAQDATGEWVERPASLQLQEGTVPEGKKK